MSYLTLKILINFYVRADAYKLLIIKHFITTSQSLKHSVQRLFVQLQKLRVKLEILLKNEFTWMYDFLFQFSLNYINKKLLNWIPFCISQGLVILVLFYVKSCEFARETTPFQKCHRTHSPDKLIIKGCTENPCKLVDGQNLKGEVQFTARKSQKVIVVSSRT